MNQDTRRVLAVFLGATFVLAAVLILLYSTGTLCDLHPRCVR